MKLPVALCLVVMASAAAPPTNRDYYSNYQDTYIKSYENDIQPNGNYRYSWEQSDNQKATQTGQIKNEGREDESLSVSGSFSWVGPDGVTYKITYTADEDGYNPEIEQGPGGSIPPAVVASLLG